MFKDFEQTGGAACTCGFYSDGPSLLEAINRWDYKKVREELEQYLTGGSSYLHNSQVTPVRRESPEDEAARLALERERQRSYDQYCLDQMRTAWRDAIPLTDVRAEPVWRYLISRNLSPRLAAEFPALRCHLELPYFDQDKTHQGNFPALLGMYFDPAGHPVTIHRIFLDHTGAKLPVEDCKKPFPLPSYLTMRGGAIRMRSPGRLLGVAEGIETALAVNVATRQVVWSCYSANGIETFEPPEGVEEVWIWADHDRSKRGVEAAKVLKRRLWEKGISARILLPAMPIPPGKKGVDWNDVLKEQGVYGFPAATQMVPLRHRPIARPELAATAEG